MVLVIFLSFLACYLPITIVKVADAEVRYPGIEYILKSVSFLSNVYERRYTSLSCVTIIYYIIDIKAKSPLCHPRRFRAEFHVLGYLLLYFASCVNPIIYVIMNKQYRQAYVGVMGCTWIRVSLTPYGSSAPGGGHQVHQDFAQGNSEHRHVVTLTKL